MVFSRYRAPTYDRQLKLLKFDALTEATSDFNILPLFFPGYNGSEFYNGVEGKGLDIGSLRCFRRAAVNVFRGSRIVGSVCI